MNGLNQRTGRAIDGVDHLRQSVADILTTPIGSRIARRTYGSLLPELVDQPDNGATRVRIFAATAGALMRWEPRLKVSRIRLSHGDRPGQVVVELEGVYQPLQGQRQALALVLPLQLRAAL
ncbi:GPW/gp25 family protein [Roseateles sp. UC29_93]|uniref:GPW/gp25 family protein n=1 Tax=Roseateles sp. UC29_93 TaxID=3350177 RepID=UPI00366BFADA